MRPQHDSFCALPQGQQGDECNPAIRFCRFYVAVATFFELTFTKKITSFSKYKQRYEKIGYMSSFFAFILKVFFLEAKFHTETL